MCTLANVYPYFLASWFDCLAVLTAWRSAVHTLLTVSYALATSVACGVAFGLKRYMAKATFSPPVTAVLSKV